MAEALALTDADQGSSRMIAVGQNITIRLAENPTTGYRWALDLDPAASVDVLGSDYVPGGTLPGAPGTREFHLRTRAVGSVYLHLRLLRSWEGESSAAERREFTLQVTP